MKKKILALFFVALVLMVAQPPSEAGVIYEELPTPILKQDAYFVSLFYGFYSSINWVNFTFYNGDTNLGYVNATAYGNPLTIRFDYYRSVSNYSYVHIWQASNFQGKTFSYGNDRFYYSGSFGWNFVNSTGFYINAYENDLKISYLNIIEISSITETTTDTETNTITDTNTINETVTQTETYNETITTEEIITYNTTITDTIPQITTETVENNFTSVSIITHTQFITRTDEIISNITEISEVFDVPIVTYASILGIITFNLMKRKKNE